MLFAIDSTVCSVSILHLLALYSAVIYENLLSCEQIEMERRELIENRAVCGYRRIVCENTCDEEAASKSVEA